MRAQLAAWVQAGKSGGAALWAQLSHAGRQTQLAINPAPKAPSAVPMPGNPVMKFGAPVAMSAADIEDVAARFVRAAEIARAAGFDGVQVHAAHGYLLSSFLSPLANRRSDDWGGSLEKPGAAAADYRAGDPCGGGTWFRVEREAEFGGFSARRVRDCGQCARGGLAG